MKQIILLLAFLSSQITFAQNKPADICPLKVGDEIPNTALTTDSNQQVSLQDLTSNKPTVIIFYRGAWCGYCTQHLAELNETKADIEKLGYQIIGITVDKSEKLVESIERSKSEIEVYSDAKAETIMAFGLDWKVDSTLFEKYKNDYKLDLEAWSGEDHHALPVPAIFIIKENKVAFQYVNPNHAVRLKATTLLAILETM